MPLQLLSESSYKHYTFFKYDSRLHKQVGFVETFNTIRTVGAWGFRPGGYCPMGWRPGVFCPGSYYCSGVNVRESYKLYKLNTFVCITQLHYQLQDSRYTAR